MSIRKDIVLDITKLKKGYSDANKETIKFARKQEKLYQDQQRELRAYSVELKRVKRAREIANDPKDIKKYTELIQKLEKDQEELRKETEKYGRAVEETSGKTVSGFKKIGMAAKAWIAGVAFAAFQLLRKGLGIAQDVEETASKFETVLGPSIGEANEFIEEYATLMGLSNTQAKEMIATTTAIAQGFGFTGAEASDLGMEVVKLAGDLQSFNDVPIERTHNAITSALSGETEALKSLGIVIRQEMVTQRAMNTTGKESVEALTQQERATATLALITEKAGVAIGDLERTQNSAANRSRQVMADIRNIAEILSKKLLPALDAGLSALEPLVDMVKDWVEVPLSDELETERVKLNSLVMQITSANTSQKRRNDLIINLQKEYPDFLDNLDAEKVTNEQLSERLADINKQYANRIVVQEQAEKVSEALEDRDRAMIDVADEQISVNNDVRKSLESLQKAGVDIDIELANKTAMERINALREALREMAEFERVVTPSGRVEFEPLNKAAEELDRLKNNSLGLASALADLRASEKELGSVQKRREEVFKALGLTTEEVTEATKKNNNATGESTQKNREWIESLPKSQLLETVTLVRGLEQQMNKLANSKLGDALVSDFDMAAGYVQQYNQALTKAHNELRAGKIDQQEYRQIVENATDVWLGQLQEIYKSFKGKLTPAQEKFFDKMFSNFKDASNEAGEFTGNLDGIADTVEALVNVADAFGSIGENAKDSLRGISSVLRGVQNIQEAADKAGGFSKLFSSTGGILSAAVPAIGIIGGLGSMLSGIFSDNDAEMAKLGAKLKELQRAVEQNTEAFYSQAIVAPDVSKTDIEQGQSIASELGSLSMRGLVQEWLEGQMGDKSSFGKEKDLLKQLGELFPDLFGTALERFETAIKAGDLQTAFSILQGASEKISELSVSVGESGDSIKGAIQTFEDNIKYAGMTVHQAFDQFINDMRDLGHDIPQHFLDEMKNLDLSTEEGKERMKEIVEILFDSDAYQGNMTESEWRDLLNQLLSSADKVGSATGSEASGYSRSVQIARSITDVQANEVIMFLERIETWTRLTAAKMGSDLAIDVTQNAGPLPKMSIPIPLPVRVVNDEDIVNRDPISGGDRLDDSLPPRDDDPGGGRVRDRSVKRDRSSANMNVSVGDVHVGNSQITDADIDEVGRQVAQKIKREIRGKQF